MEMNKYLIAALYVVAGCVATLPINVRGGNVSVKTDCYRLLVSSTEKVITVATEKRSTEDFDYGDFYKQNHAETVDAVKVYTTYSSVVLPGWKVPEIAANPIRAPGKMEGFRIYDFRFTIE